jgi:hypothetical protein
MKKPGVLLIENGVDVTARLIWKVNESGCLLPITNAKFLGYFAANTKTVLIW